MIRYCTDWALFIWEELFRNLLEKIMVMKCVRIYAADLNRIKTGICWGFCNWKNYWRTRFFFESNTFHLDNTILSDSLNPPWILVRCRCQLHLTVAIIHNKLNILTGYFNKEINIRRHIVHLQTRQLKQVFKQDIQASHMRVSPSGDIQEHLVKPHPNLP